jgi:SAM-dependent methyltransferase
MKTEAVEAPAVTPTPTEHQSYDPDFFAPLFEAEDRHFWFRARNQVIATLVSQITAGMAPGYRFLEVGCGDGNVLRVLERVCRDGTVIGMDLFAEGLRYARLRASCPLVQGDIHANPFARQFELIGLFDVLEHLPDDMQVLRDIRAMLAPGGALLLTVPAHQSLWSYFDDASHHRRRYEQVELQMKLKSAGYRVEYISQYMMSIFPLVWLGRRVASLIKRSQKGGARNPQQTHQLAVDELRVRPGVNGVLTWLLSQESRLIAGRKHLPVGTSLLAVARKEVGP